MSADAVGTLDGDRATALPRSNGELVFETPWQSRMFGAAVALQRRGALDFEEFRAELIEEIQSWERSPNPADEGWAYYERPHAPGRTTTDRARAADRPKGRISARTRDRSPTSSASAASPATGTRRPVG